MGVISGGMIRDLPQSVELRFRSTETPHPLQCLSDNDSHYRAHEAIEANARLATSIRSLGAVLTPTSGILVRTG